MFRIWPPEALTNQAFVVKIEVSKNGFAKRFAKFVACREIPVGIFATTPESGLTLHYRFIDGTLPVAVIHAQEIFSTQACN